MNANDNFDGKHTGKFFEEFITRGDGTPKCLGVRVIEDSEGRAMGSLGRRDLTLTSPITLQRGHKSIVIKASLKRPLHVFTMLQKLEGRK